MNLKAVLMLCLTFFAFASAVAATTIVSGTRTSDVFNTTSPITCNIESAQVLPTGDPIDDEEFAPM